MEAVCSVPFTLAGNGNVRCLGDLTNVIYTEPVADLTPEEIALLATAAFSLWALAYAMKFVIRFIISTRTGRG
ncbi:hypothetical protein OAK26_01240 [Gammaproteobacteria bacterium]|nr:hypothetical protein [Gammaproteobacteria bacterium]